MLATGGTTKDNLRMNRDRTFKELERRYREAVQSTKEEIKTPLQYEQLLTVIAHYMQFMSEKSVLRKAVDKLTKEKKLVKTDKDIADEADTLVTLLKTDRDKLVKIAKRKNIPIEVVPSPGGRIPEEQRFALTLSSIDSFLAHDDREISEIPKHLGNLRVMVWALRKQGVSERTLKPYTDPYSPQQEGFSKKLLLNKLYKNYRRLDDYRILESVREFIYREMSDQNEQLAFLMLDNDDLIDFSNTKTYDDAELESAKQRQIEYRGNILRFHNYLIDELENTPTHIKIGRWLFNNFGSTFVSVLLIVAAYYGLIWLGVPIDPDKLISLLK